MAINPIFKSYDGKFYKAIEHQCSDGTKVTESQIKAKYSKALKKKHAGEPAPMCECCQRKMAVDNSHIISQARLKQLHKTELIWNLLAFFNSCRLCHQNWENVKGGRWVFNANLEHCMQFLKEHDPEGYQVRLAIMEDIADKEEFVQKYF